MTGSVRGLIGVLIGVVLTLVAHPLARSLTLTAFRRIDPAVAGAALDVARPSLPAPTTLPDASLWIHEACERLRSREVTKSEWLTIEQIAAQASARQPDNAFWAQAMAIACSHLDDLEGARRAWKRGANALTYNDFQSENILVGVGRLSALQGARESWQIAYGYRYRTDSVARCAFEVGQRLLAGVGENAEGLSLRYETIVNGDLMRSGSRGVLVASRASDLVELTTYPVDEVTAVRRPKRLHLGKVRLLAALRAAGMRDEYIRAEHAFIENEAWREVILKAGNEVKIRDRAIESVALATLPGASLLVGSLGAIGCGLIFLPWKWPTRERLDPIGAIVWALVTGGGAWRISGYWLVGLAVAFGVGFLAASPNRRRSHPPEDLGPFYRFTTFTASIAITFALIVVVSLSLSPARLVSSLAFEDLDLDNLRDAAGGVAGLGVCVLAVATTIWAFVVRVATPHILHQTVRRLTVYVACFGLFASVAATLVATREERHAASDWNKIVSNEPLFHLSQ